LAWFGFGRCRGLVGFVVSAWHFAYPLLFGRLLDEQNVRSGRAATRLVSLARAVFAPAGLETSSSDVTPR
jgi:hypothetical protein